MLINFKENRGFTLIELLTVIAIIGLLATLGMTSLSVSKERANVSSAQHNLNQIFKAITLMQDDTNQWPGHQVLEQSCIHLMGGCPVNNEICGADVNANDCINGLLDGYTGLFVNDLVTPYSNWSGPYIKNYMAEDPWGNEYFFDTDYSVDVDDNPCACSSIGCHNVAVLGSYGPDGLGKPTTGISGAYGCDDIILIIAR